MTQPFVFTVPPSVRDARRNAIAEAAAASESGSIAALLAEARLPSAAAVRAHSLAATLVEEMRQRSRATGGIDAFLHEYELSSPEGVVLMCLAEALLRVPDAATVDLLIRDKLGGADWERHVGRSDSLFVNASTWALLLSGRIVAGQAGAPSDWSGTLVRLFARTGEPVIRQAVTQAMRILGRAFVMGRTIEDALARAEDEDAESRGYRHSFDMLGEAARTRADAERYFDSYAQAIRAIGRASAGRGPEVGPGVSIKLSALSPRFELAQQHRLAREILPRLIALAELAADQGIGLTLDAEESERLEPSLDVIAAAAAAPSLAGWDGFGLAVQAYQKRAPAVIDWAVELARHTRRRLGLRLVKGAYWDSEIKRAQVHGFDAYPVFTRKASTDVSYLACAARMLAAGGALRPAFATHNPVTLAWVLEAAGARRDFEFQRLHGMGEALYDQLVPDRVACRIYAPVGGHEDLLAYLVRRLLENGANTSFVNRVADASLPIEHVVADPVARIEALEHKPHPAIPLPRDLYGTERKNARGLDLSDPASLAALKPRLEAAAGAWSAAPLIGGEAVAGSPRVARDPANLRRELGTVVEATTGDLARALGLAAAAQSDWDASGPQARARVLERAADGFEAGGPELMARIIREGGRTLTDALAEVREAVDYLRYYAARARSDAGPLPLPGPTGERNELRLHGRGVFACISPWNFPLAIFTGQVAAALAAGNAVIAKPAAQTALTAARAIAVLHQAGVPPEVLAFLPGRGSVLGPVLAADARVAGIALTGSTATAQAINRALAARDGPIPVLIAETGGQNAMIADSTALPEQVVHDALLSAFDSAGQRCSALRVLFLQADIADKVETMLAGAMEELVLGDPGLIATDIGPVIDEASRALLEAHAARMQREARLLGQAPMPSGLEDGVYFAPRAYAIESISQLTEEVFGPILHVVRYSADRLDAVVDAINMTGFGLTLGVHSRIAATVERVRSRARVGNLYVNRSQIGAVVGAQPFGGEGLSGTGPKAGGPNYLPRFAVERVVSTDTTAAGGNASLLALED